MWRLFMGALLTGCPERWCNKISLHVGQCKHLFITHSMQLNCFNINIFYKRLDSIFITFTCIYIVYFINRRGEGSGQGEEGLCRGQGAT